MVWDTVLTTIHHGGKFDKKWEYIGECIPHGVCIDKDHFSLPELWDHTKELGYVAIGELYYLDMNCRKMVLLDSDSKLLNIVNNLGKNDDMHIYVQHVVNEPTFVDGAPIALIGGPDVGVDESINVSGPEVGPRATNSEPSNINTHQYEAANLEEDAVEKEREDAVEKDWGDAVEVEEVGAEKKSEDDVEKDGGDAVEVEKDEGGAGVDTYSDLEIDWTESDVGSDDSQVDAIPDEDGSDVPVELRELRKERRKKLPVRRKKAEETQEIELEEARVDRGFADIGKNKAKKYAGKLGGDEEYLDSSDCWSEDSSDELDPQAERGVDLPRRKRSSKMRYDPSCQFAIFELGMIFENAIQFRKVVSRYAVENKVQLKLRPNERHRVRVTCKGLKCKWLLYAAIDRDSGDFMVKNYNPVHRCTRKTKNTLCNSRFIAEKYKDTIVGTPQITLTEIQRKIRKELGLYVGRTVIYRAKHLVMKQFLGDWELEFNRLCDYADVIKESNPGSSCWIRTDRETEPGKNLFVYFYVCFEAMKRGWKEGCRRVIGFDGCFLKGVCSGELLVAIGKNGNNQMFPIAWAVVGNETKHSWTWFITHLIEDLDLGLGEGLTVMSDMQKGLIPTIRQLLPNCEQRMCARHIWANWSKTHRGEEKRLQFWRCARTSFTAKLQKEMEELDKLGDNICEDLLCYNKEFWCRAYFQEHSRCDIVENNMCETFNSWILQARHKSVISMLEEIRHKMMGRHVDMRKFGEGWKEDISPLARLILDQSIDKASACEVVWNASVGFEVDDDKYRHTVDIRNKTCSCRLWMLRGIPCAHAVCAYFHIDQDPEDHVEHWYRRETFLKAYDYYIQPIPNMAMWPESNNMKIEPPPPKTMPGRPKRNRRKAKDEPRKKHGKMSKKGVRMTCSKCHQSGHNKSGCKSQGDRGSASQPPPVQQYFQQESSQPSTQQSRVSSSSVCADTSAVGKEPTATGRGRGRGVGVAAGRGRGAGVAAGRGRGAGVNGEAGRGRCIAGEAGRGRGTAAEAGRGRGTTSGAEHITGTKRGMGKGESKTSTDVSEASNASKRARKPSVVGYGLYTGQRSGKTFINPGTASERVFTEPVKISSATPIEIGFKPHGLKWKGVNAVSGARLQQMSTSRRNQIGASSATRFSVQSQTSSSTVSSRAKQKN